MPPILRFKPIEEKLLAIMAADFEKGGSMFLTAIVEFFSEKHLKTLLGSSQIFTRFLRRVLSHTSGAFIFEIFHLAITMNM